MATLEEVEKQVRANPYAKQELHPLYKTASNDLWTTPTKIACWHCGSNFDHPPYPLPVKFDKVRCRFFTNGIHCTLRCVKARICSMGGADKANRLDLLTTMAVTVYGWTGPIQAINIHLLDKFGGDIPYETYLDEEKALQKRLIREPPFVMEVMAIEEQVRRRGDAAGSTSLKRAREEVSNKFVSPIYAPEELVGGGVPMNQTIGTYKRQRGRPKGSGAGEKTKRSKMVDDSLKKLAGKKNKTVEKTI